jgi:hypothetical protein
MRGMRLLDRMVSVIKKDNSDLVFWPTENLLGRAHYGQVG